MQDYKSYHVYTKAVCTNGSWRGKAVVIKSSANLNRQLKRIETVPDFLFLTKQDAEAFAFKLSKHWIDAVTSRSMSVPNIDWRSVGKSGPIIVVCSNNGASVVGAASDHEQSSLLPKG